FGEFYDDAQCNEMYDNCRHPKKRFDAKDDFVLAMQTVVESKERFKAAQIINTLRGNLTSILKTHSANLMTTWMEGTEKNESYWDNVIRQAVVQGYLERDIETYGVIKI